MVITFDNYIYITSVPKKNVPSAVVLLSTALGTFFCGTDVILGVMKRYCQVGITYLLSLLSFLPQMYYLFSGMATDLNDSKFKERFVGHRSKTKH